MDGLHAGMLSDSRQIVTQLHVLHQDDGEESAELLIQLLRDNPPAALAQYLAQDVLPNMKTEFWDSMGPQVVGGADKYNTWVTVVELLCTPDGMEWLSIAHSTCHLHEPQLTAKLAEAAREEAEGQGQVAGESGMAFVEPGSEDYEMENLI